MKEFISGPLLTKTKEYFMLKIDLYSVITWLPPYEIDYRLRHPNSLRAFPFKCYKVRGLQMVKRKDVEAYVKQHIENK